VTRTGSSDAADLSEVMLAARTLGAATRSAVRTTPIDAAEATEEEDSDDDRPAKRTVVWEALVLIIASVERDLEARVALGGSCGVVAVTVVG
jgi:hypothetical protein